MLLLTNQDRKTLLPYLYDFMGRLKDLRSRYEVDFSRGNLPKYLLETALLLEALRPEQYSFTTVCSEMENLLLLQAKNPKNLFEYRYFPLYYKLAKESLGGKGSLLFGRRHFKTATDVFASARLSNAVYENGRMSLSEVAPDTTVPLPIDLVILHDIIEKTRSILRPTEHDALTHYFSEANETDPLPTHVQGFIKTIRERLSLGIEEEGTL